MDITTKIFNVIYDSGYVPVTGNHKRGHVDLDMLVENMVAMLNKHYGDNALVLSRLENGHAAKLEDISMALAECQKELSILKSRNWYQRLFNLKSAAVLLKPS